MYNSVSTLNFFYNNVYLEYIFDNTLHKFQCNIFLFENEISDSQEGAKLCLSSIFPDGEEVYNRQKHQLPCAHGRATYSFPFFKSKIQSLVVERDYL